MRLKGRTKVELAKIFAQGSCPMASRLLTLDKHLSEWRVDMLTGPIPNMVGWPFFHRKQFYPAGHLTSGVAGCNMFFGDTRWGWFSLDDSSTVDEIDKRGVLFINYDDVCNGSITRRKIIDRVRTTNDPNVLIGEFRYFLGIRTFGPYYFSLTRIEP